MDYYTVLGVSKTATQEEIKKAYRKLAMDHHPDRGGDTIRFAEINEAYETLKDPAKRAEYDQPKTEYNFTSTNMDDILSAFFGTVRGYPNVRKNRDIRISVTLDLEEVATGKDLIASYNLLNGQSTIANIKIHAGIHDGEAIRFKGLGDNSIPSILRGDLLVLVRIKRHPVFERDGKHLKCTKEVSVFDLILGTSIVIKSLTGNEINVKIPKATQPGTIFSIAGYGLVDLNNGTTGHLYLTVKGFVPKISDDNIIERIKFINDAINTST